MVACARVFFLFRAESYYILHLYHILFIHFSMDGCFSCFHFLGIVNGAIMNMDMMCMCFFLKYVTSCQVLKTKFLGSRNNDYSLSFPLNKKSLGTKKLLGPGFFPSLKGCVFCLPGTQLLLKQKTHMGIGLLSKNRQKSTHTLLSVEGGTERFFSPNK